MFRNQPKGLIPAALANMGERFGFYTMMAILTLFLMSKFNMTVNLKQNEISKTFLYLQS